ncbi:MAG: hypothetical protein N4A33_04105 [Bacteriovoracaceae bacterium]|jgi:predicted transcriptional regulator|nr:hypothetical protein [Bacteriovoracaceae bacterium]
MKKIVILLSVLTGLLFIAYHLDQDENTFRLSSFINFDKISSIEVNKKSIKKINHASLQYLNKIRLIKKIETNILTKEKIVIIEDKKTTIRLGSLAPADYGFYICINQNCYLAIFEYSDELIYKDNRDLSIKRYNLLKKIFSFENLKLE